MFLFFSGIDGLLKAIAIRKMYHRHNFNNENKFSVSIIVKKILKHCDLWNAPDPPLAPNLFEAETEFIEEVTIDPDFFDMIA